mmetsp:Transcript_70608/g.187763  ORF Transcript_70608/g.187763 Transcript_70608/m.187763 type:complete len:208 (+) Transcript_70608:990-1613(+)
MALLVRRRTAVEAVEHQLSQAQQEPYPIWHKHEDIHGNEAPCSPKTRGEQCAGDERKRQELDRFRSDHLTHDAKRRRIHANRECAAEETDHKRLRAGLDTTRLPGCDRQPRRDEQACNEHQAEGNDAEKRLSESHGCPLVRKRDEHEHVTELEREPNAVSYESLRVAWSDQRIDTPQSAVERRKVVRRDAEAAHVPVLEDRCHRRER